ncbi:hypothetical protein [Aestuariirhabdus sp. LZHN29]|uniref:hypothetical protein n=1 Tax=Aestuariirhabdus sp. LZHN29 TaxID=3417462 RepID=UPI003CE98A2C
MTYLIIAVVVLYLVGTLTWVMPSRRDKKQALMRSRAKELGLQLQYKTRVLPHGLDRGYGAVAYMQYIQSRAVPQEGAPTLHLLRIPEDEGPVPGWTPDRACDGATSEALGRLLADLPEDVFGVLLTAGAVAVEWQEKGSLSDLGSISNTLEALLAVPLE